jgi:hypothetical protein
VETVEEGKMTKDLASCRPRSELDDDRAILRAIRENLEKAMGVTAA